MDRPPRIEVAMEVARPVVAAAMPVVSAPRSTCAPIATFRDHPVDFAVTPIRIYSA